MTSQTLFVNKHLEMYMNTINRPFRAFKYVDSNHISSTTINDLIVNKWTKAAALLS